MPEDLTGLSLIKSEGKEDLALPSEEGQISALAEQLVKDKDFGKIRQVAGAGSAGRLAFLPYIEVNNKPEGKNLTTNFVKVFRSEAGFATTDFENSFKGIILLSRWEVKPRYDEDNPGANKWRSAEFDDFECQVNLIDSDSKEVIFIGSYKEFKDKFTSISKKTLPDGDEVTKKEAQYDLWAVLYTLLEDGNIYRLHFKGASRSAWFDYSASFGYDDTFLQYITELSTSQEISGSIEYKMAALKRGEIFDNDRLKKNVELSLQLRADLNKIDAFFESKRQENLAEGASGDPTAAPEHIDDIVDALPLEDTAPPIQRAPKEERVPVSDIPF